MLVAERLDDGHHVFAILAHPPNDTSAQAAVQTTAAARAPALQFTVFTSTEPERLTKVLSLNRDGTLNKQAAASMMAGTNRVGPMP